MFCGLCAVTRLRLDGLAESDCQMKLLFPGMMRVCLCVICIVYLIAHTARVRGCDSLSKQSKNWLNDFRSHSFGN